MSRKRTLWSLLLVLALACPAQAAVIEVQTGTMVLPGVNLCTTLGGNVDSTNTIDRGAIRRPGLLKIVSVAGATPTVTVNILGSMDGTNFFNIGYAVQSTPETVTVAAITITTSTTAYYVIRDGPWRFLKLNLSANTNVTLTADINL